MNDYLQAIFWQSWCSAIIVGVVDLMNPIYPWGQRLSILGQIALVIGILPRAALKLDERTQFEHSLELTEG